MQGKVLPLLVDTGANVTILSNAFITNLEPDISVTPVEIDLVTATGEKKPFNGEYMVNIQLGSHVFEHKVLVADIKDKGILGMDFLCKNACDVMLSKQCLLVKGTRVPCFRFCDEIKGSCSTSRVAVVEQQVVPANSEMMVTGRFIDPVWWDTIGLVVPSQKFKEAENVLVAKAIIDSSNGVVPLRVVNLSDTPCTIYSDTIIATVGVIDESAIEEQTVRQIESQTSSGVQIPEHLHDLFSRFCKELSQGESGILKELLVDNQNIFSKSDEDMGMTHLVEHKLDTGSVHPIRQNPRRIPLFKAKEAEREIRDMADRGIIEPA